MNKIKKFLNQILKVINKLKTISVYIQRNVASLFFLFRNNKKTIFTFVFDKKANLAKKMNLPNNCLDKDISDSIIWVNKTIPSQDLWFTQIKKEKKKNFYPCDTHQIRDFKNHSIVIRELYHCITRLYLSLIKKRKYNFEYTPRDKDYIMFILKDLAYSVEYNNKLGEIKNINPILYNNIYNLIQKIKDLHFGQKNECFLEIREQLETMVKGLEEFEFVYFQNSFKTLKLNDSCIFLATKLNNQLTDIKKQIALLKDPSRYNGYYPMEDLLKIARTSNYSTALNSDRSNLNNPFIVSQTKLLYDILNDAEEFAANVSYAYYEDWYFRFYFIRYFYIISESQLNYIRIKENSISK